MENIYIDEKKGQESEKICYKEEPVNKSNDSDNNSILQSSTNQVTQKKSNSEYQGINENDECKAKREYNNSGGVVVHDVHDENCDKFDEESAKRKEEINKTTPGWYVVAKEKFIQIQEAYNVLSDEEKRSRYNKWETTGEANYGGFTGFNEDFINNVFKNFAGSRVQTEFNQPYAMGSDVEFSLTISFIDSVKGAKKTVTVETVANCKSCNGIGTRTGKEPDNCKVCNGSGVQYVSLTTGFHMQTICRACNGKGTKITPLNRCVACIGKGQVKEKRAVVVQIPAGIESGTVIRMIRQGDVPSGGIGIPGDLYIRLNVTPHSIFKREGEKNIIMNKEIPFHLAILGGDVQVPTIDGDDVELKVPEGSQPDQRIVLNKRGIKIGNSQGDQYVILKPRLPKHLTSQQKELIEKYEEISERSTKKKSGNFLKNLFNIFKDKK
ncbi:10187_t:CDS:2 [Entrophospora sp. SA101]|nr:10187_t:CDS:2 [Entrophospora sp. SA101]